MNREETKQILSVVAAAYANWHPVDMTAAVNLWHNLLEDYDYMVVDQALRRYLKTDKSGFAPAPGQIIDQISNMAGIQRITPAEAWAMVRKALSRSIYYYEEEFAKLPPAVKRAVGSADILRVWASSPDYDESVVSSNFLRGFEISQKREAEETKQGPNLALKMNALCLLASGEGGTKTSEKGAGSSKMPPNVTHGS